MEPAVRKAHALELFSGLPRRYDAMAGLLSFGQDRRWRRAMVDRVQASPADRVLDVATGTGMVAIELVRRYGCSVVGLDQSEPMLRRAREKLAARPELAERIELVEGKRSTCPSPTGVRLADVHLPAALRGRSGRDAARARSRGQAGGKDRVARVRRAQLEALWALWMLYTRVGLPALGRLASKDGTRSGVSSGPASPGSMSAIRSRACVSSGPPPASGRSRCAA